MKGNNFKCGFGILLGVFLALAMISCSSGPDDALPAGVEQDSGFDALASYAKAVDTTILTNPPNPSGSVDATFTFKCSKKRCAYKCLLDSGLWEACKSPKAYLALPEVAHTFRVKAKDKATGKWDKTPAVYSWLIDATPPDTTIDTNPADPSNSASAVFTFTCTDAHPPCTFECQLDSGGWSACPADYSNMTEGLHLFEVRAIDGAGNTDPTPASYSWTIDLFPDTIITSFPLDHTISTDASFIFSCTNGPCTFECDLDSAGWGACTSPKDYTGMVEGDHTFHVRAKDITSNTDPSPAAHGWAVDTTTPDTSILSNPTDPGNSLAIFEFTCNEGSCTFQCQLDSGGYLPCISPHEYHGVVDGPHGFLVYAVDLAGNVDATPASYTWTSTSNVWVIDTILRKVVTQPRADHTAVWTGTVMVVWGGYNVSYLNSGGRYDPISDSWAPVQTGGAPAARTYHEAVWTGTEMIVWGGNDGAYLNSGGRYNPAGDFWTDTSIAGAPGGRQNHSAVWTGTEMIIWGGDDGTYLNTGGRYDPVGNSWTATDTAGAPTGRYSHTAVWASDAATPVMVVWGGYSGSFENTGGRYNPAGNSWTVTSIGANVPSARYYHSAVWASGLGTPVMIVWGGYNSAYLNSGARYDPAGDLWTATSGTGAPAIRQYHSALWSGTEMFIWGGYSGSYLSSGGRYNPVADTWITMQTTGAPTARGNHTAVWTGTKFVVWGGWNGSIYYNTGGRYDRPSNSWTATSTSSSLPNGRSGHGAVWTGNEMIVWGGYGGAYLNTGSRYDPATDAWTTLPTTCAPTARENHEMVWTGTRMLVWGGWNGSAYYNTGGRYDPAANTWTTTSTTSAPSARAFLSAVWTGSQMIVWGGYGGAYYNNGGGYDPTANAWTAISTTGAPAVRQFHTAVYAGTLMIVWGGADDISYMKTGGRYDPAGNTWTATETAGAPAAREYHKAIWTGTRMVIWGGYNGSSLNSGGRYNPATDSWSTTSVGAFVPSPRQGHSMIWTGTRMIVWGGWDGSTCHSNGGRYDPVGDAWTAVATHANEPIVRAYHTAVWAESQMIVWGGECNSTYYNDGGKYWP